MQLTSQQLEVSRTPFWLKKREKSKTSEFVCAVLRQPGHGSTKSVGKKPTGL